MTLLKVGVVGCGKAKRAETSPARDLYTGGLFRASLAEAVSECGRHVYVASAKHGLLLLDEEVAPYDVTLLDYTADQRALWGEAVVGNIARLYPAGGLRLMLYAGRAYAEPLREALRNEASARRWVADVAEPLQGLGQGQRLAELKRRRLAREAMR